jgi:hypothetical protein
MTHRGWGRGRPSWGEENTTLMEEIRGITTRLEVVETS